MVRLEGSNDEWDQHTHTSGRAFLSNRRTNETRWLWQKWSMNGRLFVRNICDSKQQHWVDQMDLPMRLVSGMATPEELHQYEQARQARKLDKASLQSEQHLSSVEQQQHPSLRPLGPNNIPCYAHREHPTAPNSLHSVSYRNPFLPNQKDLYLPHFPTRTEPTHLSRHNPDRANALHHRDIQPHLPERPDSNHFGSSFEYKKPSRFPVDRNQNQPSFLYDAPQHAHHNYPNSTPQVPDVSGPPRVTKLPINGTGRYFEDKYAPDSKRQRLQQPATEVPNTREWVGKNKANKPRFTPVHKLIQRPPRPPPAPIVSGTVPPARRSSSFAPASRAAKAILKSALNVEDANRLAILHDRDFSELSIHRGISKASLGLPTGDEEYAFEPVIGTCETIEKDYLRLTSAPKPSAVRPPHVLNESLKHVKSCWRDSERDYDWVCRQMKSIRQDYKVQHIENTDVLDVYETHARIALENSDLGEFNTCVAQVQELYHKVDRIESVQDEFASYRILYNLLVEANEWEQCKILAQLSPAERHRPATRFALGIREAVVSGNYHIYFKMSLNPPSDTMISFLLARFQDQIRCKAVSAMASAYGPGQPGSLPLSFVINQLGWREKEGSKTDTFDDNDIMNAEEVKTRMMQFSPSLLISLPDWVLSALKFLVAINACITTNSDGNMGLNRLVLDCKKTKTRGVKMFRGKAKLITHAGS